MQLHHIKLTKEQLDSIPEVERTLLVLLAHAANELSVLGKVFHFAIKDPGDDPVLIEARNAQALTFGRILSGKIFECWQLLRRAFFQTQLSREYEVLFDDQSRAALSALKKYFGKQNIIEKVRNKFAFHYAPDQNAPGYATLGEGDVLDIYLAQKNANTLYVFAETIAGRALMECIDPIDHSRSIAALIDETSAAIRWLDEVIAACMLTCLNRYVGGDLYTLGANVVEVVGAPDSQDVAIPYFIEVKSEVFNGNAGAA